MGDIPQEEWTNKTELLNNPIGCGPYKVTEYKDGESVTLEAFDDFFGGKAKIGTFIMKVVNRGCNCSRTDKWKYRYY